MSIAVHDVDNLNAPMRIVTREQMMRHTYEMPPQGDDVPQKWLEQKVVMKKGDVLLRDPLQDKYWNGMAHGMHKLCFGSPEDCL